mmetsp:Transcript_344/g.580  ORF Transcript_344/g.580 Transcript_344/m.580 type:complete len:284 (-) Transcript_344:68-919(-)
MLSLRQQVSDYEGRLALQIKNAKLLGGPSRHVNCHCCLDVSLDHHLCSSHELVPRPCDLVDLGASCRAVGHGCDCLCTSSLEDLCCPGQLGCIDHLCANRPIGSRGRSQNNLAASCQARWRGKHVRSGRQHCRATRNIQANLLNRQRHASALYTRHSLHAERLRFFLCFVETPHVLVRGVDGSSHVGLNLRPGRAGDIDDQVVRSNGGPIELFCKSGNCSIAITSNLCDDGIHPTLRECEVNLRSQVQSSTVWSCKLAVLKQTDAIGQNARVDAIGFRPHGTQ